jgi:hypothetical protein
MSSSKKINPESASLFDVADCSAVNTAAYIKEYMAKNCFESFSGGADDDFDDIPSTLASDYDAVSTVNANATKINRIVAVIANALNVSAPSASASPDEKCRWMQDKVPNPRKGKSIIADKGKQRKLCQDIAHSINSEFKKKLIDVDAPTEIICNGVCDIIDSLCVGSHKQFVAVAASIQRGLNNLSQLKEVLQSAFNRLHNDAVESKDESLSSRAGGISSLHKVLMSEIDRQITILANLTTTTLKPVDRDVVAILKENSDFKGLIAGLDSQLGSQGAGLKLSQWLSNVGSVAVVSRDVNNALKKIGLSVAEYKQNASLRDLKVEADKILQKKDKSEMSRKYIGQFHAALETLSRNHGQHGAIVEFLSKSKSGGYDGGDHGEGITAVQTDGSGCKCGGNPCMCGKQGGGGPCSGTDNIAGGRDTLTKKIENNSQTKRAVLKSFKSKCKIYFDRILKATISMSKRLGSDIPLDYHLDRFIKTFSEMQPVSKSGLEFALTGVHKHAHAVAERTRFLGLLNSTLHSLEPLLSGKGGSYFSEIKTNLVNMVKLVDFYSDQFNVYEEPKIHQHFEGRFADANHVSGRGDEGDEGDEVEGGGEFSAAVTINNTITSLNHFYNIAKMKSNLAVVAEEVKDYNKNYEAMLGEAMGNEINTAEEKYDNEIKKLNGDEWEGTLMKFLSTDDGIYKNKTLNERENYSAAEITKYKKTCLEGKKAFYKAIQAIDLYLQHFTDNVAANPDNIREISKVLQSVETISQWFDETSGDYITGLYDAFPFKLENGVPTISKGLSANLDQSLRNQRSDHYYEQQDVKGGNVGNPFLPVPPKIANQMHKYIHKTYEKVFALKNLVSLFAHLGDKFGSESISEKVFMSPNQIYQALLTYLSASALTMGWEGDDSGMTAYGSSTGLGGDLPVGPVHSYRTTVSDLSLTKPTAGDDLSNGLLKRYGVAMSNVTHSPNTVGSGRVWGTTSKSNHFNDDFHQEDKLFVHTIKAMAAKVFTVAGMYNMMNYKTAPVPVLSTHRVILGGNDLYQTPTVHSEAVDLYIRLPLLAEFYLSVLGFSAVKDVSLAGTKNWRIAMIPEVDSIWSGFLQCVFDYPDRSAATYTDNQTRKVINEINGIYQRYKSKGGDIVNRCLADFVAEVNRRYGVVTKGEIEDYIKDSEQSNATLYMTDETLEDYDILDEDRMGSGLAPSDTHAKLLSARDRKVKWKFDPDHANLVCEFRKKIDDRIRSAVESYTNALEKDDEPLPGFTDQIRLTKESLLSARSNDEKFEMVKNTIQGIDYLSKKGEESLLLFNEVVVAPLAVLSKLTSILGEFANQVASLDIAEYFKRSVAATMGEEYTAPRAFDVENSVTKELIGKNTKLSLKENDYDEGYQGLKGVKIDNITQFATRNMKSKDTVECAIRHKFNWGFAYYELMNLLFGISANLDGLVEVKPHGPSMVLDFSRLQQYMEDMMQSIRANIDKLRGSVSATLIDKYEDINKLGSINQIHRELIDKLFGSRDPVNLPNCNKIVNDAFVLFTKEWNMKLKYVDRVVKAENEKTQWSFDDYVAKLTHYDSAIAFNPAKWDNAKEDEKIVAISKDSYEALYKNLVPGAMGTRAEIDNNMKKRLPLYRDQGSDIGFRDDSSGIGSSNETGLMMRFNELLHRYSIQFIDIGSNKLYTQVLSGFVNGSHASDIMSGNCWPDVGVDALVFEKKGDPEGIIFASIGKRLRTLFSETSFNSSAKMWLIDNIADVPHHMKENYKANMPLFIKWFRMIAKKANLIKQSVTSGINTGRFTDLDITNDELKEFDGNKNRLAYAMKYHKFTPQSSRAFYSSMCDNIISGCEALIGCSKKVLSELNDSPKYLELHENSISNFKSTNGVMPLMPFSTTVSQLVKPRNKVPLSIGTSDMLIAYPDTSSKVLVRDPNIAYPFYSSGHTQFEFNYANRLVLHDATSKPVLDHFPGMKEILAKYNTVSIPQKKLDESVYASILSRYVYLSRYLFDTRGIATILGAPTNVFDKDDEQTESNLPCQTTMSLSEGLRLTKNSDVGGSINRIISCISDARAIAEVMNRKDAVVFNIIDMNIMPINVHALRKEIPLANIYNYSCTFDAYIKDSLRLKFDEKVGSEASDTHQLMYTMCTAPYAKLNNKDYYVHLKSLMQGDTTLDFEGRPKFVSDQLWNKVLFNEVYGDTHKGEQHEMKRDYNPRDFSATNAAARYVATSVQPTGISLIEERQKYDNAISLVTKSLIKYYDNAIEYNKELGSTMVDISWTESVSSAEIEKLMEVETSIRKSITTVLADMEMYIPNEDRSEVFNQAYQSAYQSAVDNKLPTIDARQYAADALAEYMKPCEKSQETHSELKRKLLINIGQQITQRNKISSDFSTNEKSKNDLVNWKARLDAKQTILKQEQANADIYKNNMNKAMDSLNELGKYYKGQASKEWKFDDNSSVLTYAKASKDKTGRSKTDIKHVQITTTKGLLLQNGALRSSTKFMRNLFFLSNIQRVLRLKLRDELQKAPYPVLTSTAITNRSATEYDMNEHAGLALD